jgi:Putative bacterial sensory transduction regulator
MAAVDIVDAYLAAQPELGMRRLAHGEWGITVPAEPLGGYALDVGLRIADELLRAQALALPGADDLDPWMLLWWNRQTRLVRFGCTQSRDVWVHADLPIPAIDERAVDRLLGLVIEGTVAVRDYATRVRQPAPTEPDGWLKT